MHKIDRFGPVLLLGILLAVGLPTASANPIPCVNGSLSAFAPLAAGDPAISCQFQDLIFTFAYNEFLYQKTPGQAALAPADRIENHIDIAFVNPSAGVEGILLTPTDYFWYAQDSFNADVNFTYSVAVATPGLSLHGAAFDANITVIGPVGGGILAGETICCPAGTAASPASLHLQINQFETGVGTDTKAFVLPATGLSINKDIAIVTLGAGDLAALNSFDQLYYFDAPEPGVMVLTAGGLAFLLLRKLRNARRGLGALAVLALLGAAGANAAPLCTDTSPTGIGGNTLDKYISAGSCLINGTLFTFNAGSYSYTPPVLNNGVGNNVPASAVTVTVNTGANMGFQFVGLWLDSGSQSSRLTLTFTASAPSGMAVNSAKFTTTTSNNGLGTISGSSTVTNGLPPVGYTFPSGGVPIPVIPNLSTVTLTAVVNLAGNGTTSTASKLLDNAHLSNLVMTVAEATGIPEPMTVAFVGGGLVILSLLGRKRLGPRR